MMLGKAHVRMGRVFGIMRAGRLGAIFGAWGAALLNRRQFCTLCGCLAVLAIIVSMPYDIHSVLDSIAEMIRAEKALVTENVDWRRRPQAGGYDALEFAAPL